MKKKDFSPPKWMDKLLSFYCKEEILEDLQGDLHEYFLRNTTNKGILKAQLIYLLDVLKFFRIYTVKTPKLIRRMNYFAIFKNGLKASGRSLLRNKLFSTINIVGLSISMSIGLIVIALYSELNGFDNFHEKSERIYRVKNFYDDGEEPMHFASTSILVGEKLRAEFTGVEKVVTMSSGFELDAKFKDKVVPIRGQYASKEFGEVFDFKIHSGNLIEALSEPNSLVLTKDASEKIFGDFNSLNKVVSDNKGNNYTIRAVLDNLPKNSHLNFEVLCSFITYQNIRKDKGFMSWANMWSNHVYVLLEEGKDIKTFQLQLDNLNDEQNKSKSDQITASLQKLSGIIPGPDYSNMSGPSFDIDVLMILAILSLVILISACFNYTNLSMARSLRRAKEVGIRKTVGASKSQVFFQFILEACIISVLALIIAMIIFLAIRPHFIESLGYQGRILQMLLTPGMIFFFLIFAILSGFIAGVLPSYMMSRLNMRSVLSGSLSKVKMFSHLNLRKALVVFQFSLSMILIISAIIGFRQYRYAMNFDLGYNTENVLNVEIQGNEPKLLEAGFEKMSFIEDISFSLMIPSVGSMYMEEVKYLKTNDSTEMAYNVVSPGYLKIHQHSFLFGHNFEDEKLNSEELSMIVNEAFLEKFEIPVDENSLGEKVKIRLGKAVIVGVMKDFHFGTTENELGPFFFLKGGDQLDQNYYHANLKLKPGIDALDAMEQIEIAWNEVDDVHQFSAKFYSEEIERTYSYFKSIIKILGALAIIAISIATLGLLGMVIFTTESRVKEISIRKILGASEQNLLFLLGKGFMVLLLISSIIAIPVTVYIFKEYILKDYIYRADISVFELLAGCALILSVGLVIIVSQTLATARTNPSDTLRSE